MKVIVVKDPQMILFVWTLRIATGACLFLTLVVLLLGFYYGSVAFAGVLAISAIVGVGLSYVQWFVFKIE